MKEEGEVWQVTHENQVNVCWKCGRSGHVGARCNQPTLTYIHDVLDGVQVDTEDKDGGAGGGVQSWAHVVMSGTDQKVSNPVKENMKKKFKEDKIRRQELLQILARIFMEKFLFLKMRFFRMVSSLQLKLIQLLLLGLLFRV